MKTSLLCIGIVLALTGRLMAVVEDSTIDGIAETVGRKLKCHFVIERFLVNGDPIERRVHPVDFEALRADSNPVKFIEDRFPEYRIKRIPSYRNFYRVYDKRLEECQGYVLEKQIKAFSFTGKQKLLVTTLAESVPNLMPFGFIGPDTLFMSGWVPINVSPGTRSVREILMAASVRSVGEATVWMADTNGIYDSSDGTYSAVRTSVGFSSCSLKLLDVRRKNGDGPDLPATRSSSKKLPKRK